MEKAVFSLALFVGALGSAHAQLNHTNLALCGVSPGGMWSLVGTGVDSAVKEPLKQPGLAVVAFGLMFLGPRGNGAQLASNED